PAVTMSTNGPLSIETSSTIPSNDVSSWFFLLKLSTASDEIPKNVFDVSQLSETWLGPAAKTELGNETRSVVTVLHGRSPAWPVASVAVQPIGSMVKLSNFSSHGGEQVVKKGNAALTSVVPIGSKEKP